MIDLGGWRRLRTEVLGLNRRNLDFVQRYNKRALFAVVDHKEDTKQALSACGLPVPPTYALCRRHRELTGLELELRRWNDFVLKPAHGAGGEGVMVIAGTDGDGFRTASGRHIRQRDIMAHAADILSGTFALSQARDEALVEYRLRCAPALAAVSPGGVADVRVIVFRGIPIMAMLRLPTAASNGRANLHVGGIGVGIALSTGRTGAAIHRRHPLRVHPDTGAELTGWTVPYWETLLWLAARCHDALPLGYLGVDIVLDADRGPVILELNGRPGLTIQLANQRGLRPVLRAISAMHEPDLAAEARVALGVDIARRYERDGV